MTHLAVKDFRRFQHYKDRNPPWIKLYGTLLTDVAFLQLPEAAQAQLVKLWLLASQFGHPLPNNPKLLAGKIGSSGRFHLTTLIDAGFLIPCNEDASVFASIVASSSLAVPLANPASLAGADARSRERTEERVQSSELETTSSTAGASWKPVLESQLAARLSSDVGRSALAVVLLKAPSRIAWVAELGAMLDGMPGHVVATPDQLESALMEFVANGHAAETPNLKHFKAFVARAAMPPKPSLSPNTMSALDQWARDTDAKEKANV